MGRGFLVALKRDDATIVSIARHVQRGGGKLRDSMRYRAWVKKLRGFVKTEVNRVVNRLVAVRKPAVVGVERLRFSSPECRGG
jgi:putative transposase